MIRKLNKFYKKRIILFILIDKILLVDQNILSSEFKGEIRHAINIDSHSY